jgi:MFS family permease
VRQSLDTVGAFLGPLVVIVLMGLSTNNFTFVFWVAVIPAFLSFAVIVVGVREPERPQDLEVVRAPLSREALARLGIACWLVIGVATLFTLARFSEAFLLLRAQSVGLAIALVPAVMVVMNVVYALSAWPAGALSDAIGRFGVLAAGFALLILADLALALATGIFTVAAGVALWGLHMGLTQGVLATLIADTAPVELRGTAFGLFNLVTGIAMLVASLVAGAPSATFLAGAAFATLAMIALRPARARMGSAGAAIRPGCGSG